MLPQLTPRIPMEAKFGEQSGDLEGRNLLELNPNPLSNDLGQLKQAGPGAMEKRQDFPGGALPIGAAGGKVDLPGTRFRSGLRLGGGSGNSARRFDGPRLSHIMLFVGPRSAVGAR